MAKTLWTARRRKLVEKFISLAQTRLRLTEWEILCEFDEDCGPGAVATITRAVDQKRAVVRFNALEFLTCSAAHQRQTLVHELLHCHLFDVHEAAALAIAAVPGEAHQATLNHLVRSRVESSTDALADAFCVFFADVAVPATEAPLRAFEGATTVTVLEPPASESPGEPHATPGLAEDEEVEAPALTVVGAEKSTGGRSAR